MPDAYSRDVVRVISRLHKLGDFGYYMTEHQRSIEDIEQTLIALLSATSTDLSAQGSLEIERLITPQVNQDSSLVYHVKPPMSPTSARLSFDLNTDGDLIVDVEISIKKFITPTISLSSAHIASLITSIKRQLGRGHQLTSEDLDISWEFDRIQRRIRSITPSRLTVRSGVRVLTLVTELLTECYELSLSIIQEEAEYSRVVEQWKYARRSYLTWDQIGELTFNQLQSALSVLYQLRDWAGCAQLLESNRERFDDAVNAQLAHAAAVLYRDMLKRPESALRLSEASSKLAPENTLYRETYLGLGGSTDEERERVESGAQDSAQDAAQDASLNTTDNQTNGDGDETTRAESSHSEANEQAGKRARLSKRASKKRNKRALKEEEKRRKRGGNGSRGEPKRSKSSQKNKGARRSKKKR